jgi:hypothetical protein
MTSSEGRKQRKALALGEREVALATLEQYTREQSDTAQRATVKESIERLRSPEWQKTVAARSLLISRCEAGLLEK